MQNMYYHHHRHAARGVPHVTQNFPGVACLAPHSPQNFGIAASGGAGVASSTGRLGAGAAGKTFGAVPRRFRTTCSRLTARGASGTGRAFFSALGTRAAGGFHAGAAGVAHRFAFQNVVRVEFVSVGTSGFESGTGFDTEIVVVVGFHSQRTRFARGIVFVIVCVFRNMTPS